MAENKTVIEAVLENMDQGVIMYDADFKIRAFNDRAREYWDFPESILQHGTSYEEINQYLADRGDMGEAEDGDLDGTSR